MTIIYDIFKKILLFKSIFIDYFYKRIYIIFANEDQIEINKKI